VAEDSQEIFANCSSCAWRGHGFEWDWLVASKDVSIFKIVSFSVRYNNDASCIFVFFHFLHLIMPHPSGWGRPDWRAQVKHQTSNGW
jgi:hypothetical protein